MANNKPLIRTESQVKMDLPQLFNLINYHRSRKEQGFDWIPKQSSALHRWCIQNGKDPEKLILGEQQLTS